MSTWTPADELLALKQGWGMFSCDDGKMRIQKMDDPMAHHMWVDDGTILVESPFKSDVAAVRFVRRQAAAGCPTAKKAIERHGKRQPVGPGYAAERGVKARLHI